MSAERSTPISLYDPEDPRPYCTSLAMRTAERYGAAHVVPMTGGGDHPLVYWRQDEDGEWQGLIRGSYTRERLPA